MQALMGFMLAMTITVVLIPLLIRWAGPLRILDMPEARKVHALPVPRVGGIAMVAGVLSALLLLSEPTRPMRALWAGIAMLLIFGVWDDRHTLAAGPKFAGQVLAVAMVMGWGSVNFNYMTVIERMPVVSWIGMPLTFLFLLGGTNAFNLADGLDGLAGGMAVVCLCGTALLAYTVGNISVGGTAVVMIGALVGFLRFNTHPARVFMGDGGSQMLGFTAAVLALLLTQDPDFPLSTALPLLLLGIPIIDTLMVMTERVLAGSSPFLADRRHIHHRLLALGFAHWEAVAVLYLLQGGLFIAAWFMRYDSDLRVLLSFVLIAALIILPLRLAQHCGWRLRRGAGSPAANNRQQPQEDECAMPRREGRAWLRASGAFALGAALSCYAVWVLTTGAIPSRDVQLLALSLALILGLGLLLRWRRGDAYWTDKVALYSCAALAIFLGKHGLPGLLQVGAAAAHRNLIESGLYAVLALAMLACIRQTADRPFRLSTLDVLVLFVVVIVPNLPDSVARVRSLGLSLAELVLLFYCVEALSSIASARWRWINGGAVLFLLGLSLRALI
jgi:UDP-GlcNAc:undecaprenyl-phosphate GlcNAc-1-phosphate transferase